MADPAKTVVFTKAFHLGNEVSNLRLCIICFGSYTEWMLDNWGVCWTAETTRKVGSTANKELESPGVKSKPNNSGIHSINMVYLTVPILQSSVIHTHSRPNLN